MAIELVRGDITRLAVDVIVNAANSSLLGGGGVDGAIHRAAGPGLLAECRALGGCPVGEARLTGGHDLPARFVIHTVGPVWQGGRRGEPDLLAACYRNSLALAAGHWLASMAFPAISCGVYRYPVAEACCIAVRECRSAPASVGRILLVAFDEAVFAGWSAALTAKKNPGPGLCDRGPGRVPQAVLLPAPRAGVGGRRPEVLSRPQRQAHPGSARRSPRPRAAAGPSDPARPP